MPINHTNAINSWFSRNERENSEKCITKMILSVNQLSVFLFVLSADPSSPQIPYSQLQSHSLPGQVDMWTKHHTGCACPHNILDHTCACCAQGGCHCGLQNRMRCVQCGLEEGCGQSKYQQNLSHSIPNIKHL